MASPAVGTRIHVGSDRWGGVDVGSVRCQSVSGLAMDAICVTRKATKDRLPWGRRGLDIAAWLACESSVVRVTARVVKPCDNWGSRTFAVASEVEV